jgi:pseudaminic acid synthase
MASLSDIESAVGTCREAGNNDLVLLKCTSAYPTPLEEVHLRTLPTLKATFGCEVGLSDHTLGNVAAGVAVTLGARLVEKHLILDRSLGGPDAEFSLDVDGFSGLVQTIRDTEKVLGSSEYVMTETMRGSRHFSRSLYISQDVKDGEVITPNNVRSVRPGHGLHPKFLPQILGKKFQGSYEVGTRLSLSKIADFDG